MILLLCAKKASEFEIRRVRFQRSSSQGVEQPSIACLHSRVHDTFKHLSCKFCQLLLPGVFGPGNGSPMAMNVVLLGIFVTFSKY